MEVLDFMTSNSQFEQNYLNSSTDTFRLGELSWNTFAILGEIEVFWESKSSFS